MTRLICNYAPVRFLPYRETGEFANVGMVVHCPQTDAFIYRLLPSKQAERVTSFFPGIPRLFEAALQGLERELARVQATHQLLPTGAVIAPNFAQIQTDWFRELVRRREGLLHFGEPGTLMADAAEDALEVLFQRFMERQPEPEEQASATSHATPLGQSA